MGRPKALLACGPGADTFVSHVVTAMRDGGADDVLVVARADDEDLRREVLRGGARVIVNPDPDRGQLSSLLAGLDAADRPGVAGVLVMPVDIPFVRAATVARLKAAFAAGDAPIVRPVFAGRHGHPVIFGRRAFDDLRRADPAIGAKAVVRAHAASILDVEVDDPMILRDVDTPDDYRVLLAGDEG